jgi:hypothetical protein
MPAAVRTLPNCFNAWGVRRNTMTTNKLTIEIKEFLEKSSTKDFLLAARQFVNLLEAKINDKAFLYSKAHLTLLELYVA